MLVYGFHPYRVCTYKYSPWGNSNLLRVPTRMEPLLKLTRSCSSQCYQTRPVPVNRQPGVLTGLG
ncbi:hypothetical protein FRX31_031008 [Thalictrum thalictroides]|uniref:Uncharacterized protein n=1 Tax=Thalictrum thalictroides TaxID=46969 RepID=A0A7J6V313_THATH|nr:hypothetical protein FRX31_031008 [Thalictrum thalictroides]